MYLDLFRILFLVTVAVAHIVESILDACNTKCTLKAVMRSLLYLACLVLFAIEGAYIAMQTPTADILAKNGEVIDFSELVYKYQMLFYMQAVNLILLISFLIPFF